MAKLHGILAATIMGLGLNASAVSVTCGLGGTAEKLEIPRSTEIDRGAKELTIRSDDKNRYCVKYYQAKIYLDYRDEGDRDKDVVELILATTSGQTAISSQKVSNLSGGEAFTLYLVGSPTNYVQLLCLIKK